MGTKVHEVMSTRPRSVTPQTSLNEVAQLMAAEDVGAIPVVEGDRLVVGTVMTVTLTADHRAVDGARAAEFLQTLKGLLEEPTSMLL